MNLAYNLKDNTYVTLVPRQCKLSCNMATGENLPNQTRVRPLPLTGPLTPLCSRKSWLHATAHGRGWVISSSPVAKRLPSPAPGKLPIFWEGTKADGQTRCPLAGTGRRRGRLFPWSSDRPLDGLFQLFQPMDLPAEKGRKASRFTNCPSASRKCSG